MKVRQREWKWAEREILLKETSYLREKEQEKMKSMRRWNEKNDDSKGEKEMSATWYER